MAKRYKMNEGQVVNAKASASGIKWRYRGKFETIAAAVAEAKRWTGNAGVRVTDCETDALVYEEMWTPVIYEQKI